MKYETADAFRMALERRLQNHALDTGVALPHLRRLVVFDRLLARLLTAAPDGWLLKGAVALIFRGGLQLRTTKDLDLACRDTERQATLDLTRAANIDLGDFFGFVVTRTPALDVALGGIAVRYRVRAELAGRLFDRINLDVGFGAMPLQAPEMLTGPDLLRFADISPVAVPALPLATHVAEKVHAYSRSYAAGRQSTRVKDLIDLLLISSTYTFRRSALRQALEETFGIRGAQALPLSLPLPPANWPPAYRTMAVDVGIDPDILHGYGLAAEFLDPVLTNAVSDNTLWSPVTRRWEIQLDMGTG